MMRLFPRFSLRFAWIALTIFLVVFAVVVNYYQRYQAHERIALQLQNKNCDVEEEPITLAGFVIGKRLTGIQVPPQSDAAYLELLETLPRPHEIRRFGNGDALLNQEIIVRLLASIERFTELEELHLDNLTFTEEQAAFLGRLPKLRVLDLTRCNLPAGSLQLLAKMPHLETLVLNEAVCDPTELFEINLPSLRKLSMNESSLMHLELTKQGWGRFPLETLVMRANKLQRIRCEAGALPRLKHLDLGPMGHDCQIDWPGLPAALPELTLLALPTPWLTAKVIPQLARWEKLRFLYFDGDMLPQPSSWPKPGIDPFAISSPPATEKHEPESDTKPASDPFAVKTPPPAESPASTMPAEPPFEPQLTIVEGGGQTVHDTNSIRPFAPLDLASNPEIIPATILPAIKDLLQKRTDLLFSSDYSAVIQMLDLFTGYGCAPITHPLWSSPNWRPNPNNQGGGFF